jgi:hypothetical protein
LGLHVKVRLTPEHGLPWGAVADMKELHAFPFAFVADFTEGLFHLCMYLSRAVRTQPTITTRIRKRRSMGL